MEEVVKIIIPSHKRPDRILTKKAVDNCILCVEESQVAEYNEHNPELEIITHPDSIIGLTLKKRWMMEYFGGDIFMIDDDIKSMNRLYVEKGEKPKITSDLAYEIVQTTAVTARNLGAYLFGFNKNQRPVDYVSHTPFRLTGFAVGGWAGILKGSKLYYPDNEEGLLCQDFFVSGLNAFHHRHCFLDNRFGFTTVDNFKNPGGCAEYRTVELEKRTTLWLREQFGEAIQIKKPTGGHKNLSSPYERRLHIPF